MEQDLSLSRRAFLLKALAAAGGLSLSALLGEALAKRHMKPGIKQLKGQVMVNGTPAAKDGLINPEDRVTTSKDGRVVFVMGLDAFLVHGGSDVVMTVSGQQKSGHAINSFKLKAGKVLSVFAPGGRRRIVTPTAVAGVRGTGLYVEAEAAVTYLCLCYGEMELEATQFAGVKEEFSTKHHEQPRYVLGSGSPILPAPMLNHTDDELFMLEALVDRKPPFEIKGGAVSGGYPY